MNKKSQGLSINVIIIVAIALIVLVVLIAVFTGRLGNFTRALGETASCESSCNAFGMDWENTDKSLCQKIDKSRIVPGTYDDITGEKVCCCITRT
jgi:ABC-type uncharacterized transport system permease subunit